MRRSGSSKPSSRADPDDLDLIRSVGACGLAGGEFDDLRGDLLLPHVPLRRLQAGELALDLVARGGHRFHARLVLGREGMQRRLAKLRVQVVRGQRVQQVAAAPG